MDELQRELLELEEKASTLRNNEAIDVFDVLVKHQVLLEKFSQLVVSTPELKAPFQQYIDERKSFEIELEDSINSNRKNGTQSLFRLSDSVLSSTTGNLVRFIDQLQDSLGLEFLISRISLPKIIVVGDESVGKSSVLESISGVPLFPRSKTRCTRVPFELRLHRTSASTMKEKFNQEKPVMQFGHLPDKTFSKPSSVRDEVEKFTQAQVSGKGVEDKRLVLNIYSTDVADLTLIDLPGIVVVPKVGDPDNIFEQTTALVKKYMTEDTLVLVVVPATHALISSQGLRLVRQTKSENRTLGVLTMLDRADVERDGPREKITGTHPDWVPLPQGYIGVINRDTYVKQGSEEETLSETKEKEQQFLQQKYPELLEKELVGIDSLNKKLSQMLLTHIQEVWAPKMKSEIQRIKASLTLTYQAFGAPTKISIQEVIRMIATLCLQIKSQLQEKPQEPALASPSTTTVHKIGKHQNSSPTKSSQPALNFGSNTSSATQSTSFSFGGAPPTTAFTFGSPATSSSTPQSSGFSFGGATTASTFASPATATRPFTASTSASQSTPAFSFGSPSTTTSSSKAVPAPASSPSFGSASTPSTHAFTFGSTKTTEVDPKHTQSNNNATGPFGGSQFFGSWQMKSEPALIYDVSKQSMVAMVRILDWSQNAFANLVVLEKTQLLQAIAKQVIEPAVEMINFSFFPANPQNSSYEWTKYPKFKQVANDALKKLLADCSDKLHKNLETFIEAEMIFKDTLPFTPLEKFLQSSSQLDLNVKKRMALSVFKMTWKVIILDFCDQSEKAIKVAMLGDSGMKIEELLEEEPSLRTAKNKILNQLAFLGCAEHQLSKIKNIPHNANTT